MRALRTRPPIFRLFGGRVPVADRRDLIRKYATPVWKIERRLDAALGRSRSIKGRMVDRLIQHSNSFLFFSYPPLPRQPFQSCLVTSLFSERFLHLLVLILPTLFKPGLTIGFYIAS